MFNKKIITAALAFAFLVEGAHFLRAPDTAMANVSIAGSESIGGSSGYNPLSGPSYPIEQDSYFTDDSGNILMFVNIIGEVAKQGQFIIRENADFATILALSGGITKEANLKKVLVVRNEPDNNGRQAYIINLKPFYKKGDRVGFIALKPNDTIIIPEKGITLEKIARYSSMISPLVYWYYLIDRK